MSSSRALGGAGLEPSVTPSATNPAKILGAASRLAFPTRLVAFSFPLLRILEGRWRWSAAFMAGVLATLLPQNEPGESGGNCKMPRGKGVGGALARDGP